MINKIVLLALKVLNKIRKLMMITIINNNFKKIAQIYSEVSNCTENYNLFIFIFICYLSIDIYLKFYNIKLYNNIIFFLN